LIQVKAKLEAQLKDMEAKIDLAVCARHQLLGRIAQVEEFIAASDKETAS
jgi:hypothetical protein